MARSKNEESKGLDLIENPEAIISKTEAFFNDKKKSEHRIYLNWHCQFNTTCFLGLFLSQQK